MPTAQAYIVRSTAPDTVRVQGVWTGGGAAANMTKAAADFSKGITGVTYNAATGEYLIGFQDVGSQIISANVTCVSTTGVIVKDCNVLRNTLSQSAKTVQLEIFTKATDLVAPALVDLLTTFQIMIDITFVKNPQ